jgi:hypothetical protein
MISPLDEYKHMDMLQEIERQAAAVRLIKEAEMDRPGLLSRLASALAAGLGWRAPARRRPSLPVSHAHAR